MVVLILNMLVGIGLFGNFVGVLVLLEMLGFVMGFFDGDGCEDDWVEFIFDFDEELVDFGLLFVYLVMVIEMVVMIMIVLVIVLLWKVKVI